MSAANESAARGHRDDVTAAVLYEPNEPLRIEQVSLDPPKAGEVLVRVHAAGVCHSDYHFMSGAMPTHLPCVMGHEGAGIVEEVGEGVTSTAPGDHVVLLFRGSCGLCEFCSSGRPNLCRAPDRLFRSGGLQDGTSRLSRNGSELKHFSGVSCFATHAVVPERAVMPIDHDIPFKIAAVVGCAVLTGVGAVLNTAKVEAGASVLVLGAGGVGLNAIMAARLAGANPVIAADTSDATLELATEVGATAVVNVERDDLRAAVKELTRDGVDYALEAVGRSATMSQAFRAVRRGGTMVAIGVAPAGTDFCVNPIELVFEEKTVMGSHYGSTRPRNDIDRILALYRAGVLPLDALVTAEYALDEVNAAYENLLGGSQGRAVLVPG